MYWSSTREYFMYWSTGVYYMYWFTTALFNYSSTRVYCMSAFLLVLITFFLKMLFWSLFKYFLPWI